MSNGHWDVLIGSLFDHGNGEVKELLGPDLNEWLGYVQFDYDEIDRDRIDSETKGG